MTQAFERLNEMDTPSRWEKVGQDDEPLYIREQNSGNEMYTWARRMVKHAEVQHVSEGWVYGLYSDGSAIAINLV